MKMRPGTQTGFLLCGKEWIDGDPLEVCPAALETPRDS